MNTIFTKIIALLFLLMIMGYTYAQSPQAFNYQAVARDVSGSVIQNHALGISISLHKGSDAGTVVYSETHTPSTNNFGLFTLTIGTGTPVIGLFDTIAWNNNKYWLQVEMDASGGTSYTNMGTSQLLSVPYAFYAENTGAIPKGKLGQTMWNNDTVWVADTTIYNNGTNVGIGTTNPGCKLDIIHGGTTGLRVKSTSSFSAIDIDAATGDAALRFQRLGVNQWNIRNSPGNDDLEFFELGGGGMRMLIQNTTGFLGLGTYTPTAKLHVEGDARITGALFDGSNSPGTDGSFLKSTGTTTQWVSNAITSYAGSTSNSNTIASTTISSGTVTTLLQITAVPAGTYGVYFSSPIRNQSTSSAGINLIWAVTSDNGVPSFPIDGIANSFIPATGWIAQYPFGQSGYREVTLTATGTIELKISYYGILLSGTVTSVGTTTLRAIKL